MTYSMLYPVTYSVTYPIPCDILCDIHCDIEARLIPGLMFLLLVLIIIKVHALTKQVGLERSTGLCVNVIGSSSTYYQPFANQLSCHQTFYPEKNTTNRSIHVVQQPTQCPYPISYNQQA